MTNEYLDNTEVLKPPFQAVIFDKDGVLMLTEQVYFQAYKDTISFFEGLDGYSWEYHQKHMGNLSSEKFLEVRKDYSLETNLNDFSAEYRRRYLQIFENDGVAVPEGVKEFLELLKKANIKSAIVTGSSKRNADLTLEKTGLISKFDAVITGDDVSVGKPHPEGFLLAAERLRVDPAECLVIGDALNDIVAARAAGMKVLAIIDADYTRDPELAKPDMEVHSLTTVNLDTLKRLFTSM